MSRELVTERFGEVSGGGRGGSGGGGPATSAMESQVDESQPRNKQHFNFWLIDCQSAFHWAIWYSSLFILLHYPFGLSNTKIDAQIWSKQIIFSVQKNIFPGVKLNLGIPGVGVQLFPSSPSNASLLQ